jgi:hypothetical protein
MDYIQSMSIAVFYLLLNGSEAISGGRQEQ